MAVGDIHRCWRQVDSVYLERAQSDLTMFVGDLGDEDLEMVTRIADLPIRQWADVAIRRRAGIAGNRRNRGRPGERGMGLPPLAWSGKEPKPKP